MCTTCLYVNDFYLKLLKIIFIFAYTYILYMSAKNRLLIGFNWPLNEQYDKLRKMAKLSGLSFQMFVIAKMSEIANRYTETENNLNK